MIIYRRIRMKVILIILLTSIFFSCNPSPEKLIMAIKNNDEVTVDELLNKNIDIDDPVFLKSAINIGNIEIIDKLIKSGCPIELTSEDLKEPTRNKRIDILSLLIRNGLDFNMKNGFGKTIFEWALYFDEVELIKDMIVMGLDVNQILDGARFFDFAIWNYDFQMLSLIVENGGVINQVNNEGKTPLSIAIAHGQIDKVLYLLEMGADVNLAGNNMYNPWEILPAYWQDQYIEVANIFWDRGLRFIYEDDNSLHYAVWGHDYKYIDWLLAKGADPLKVDEHGYQPIDYTHKILENYHQNYDGISDISLEERSQKADELYDKLKKYEMTWNK